MPLTRVESKKRGVASATLLVLAAGCSAQADREDQSPYAGLSIGQATRTVHSRAERAHPVDTFPYGDEAVHSKTPLGVDAWLVKVDYAGYEGDLCAYVWRDGRRKKHVQWDGSGSGYCEHWKYD